MTLRHRLVTFVQRDPRLLRLALMAWSVRHPPPWRRPTMEFDFDPWNAVSSLHYRGGRQIGEDNAGPYPYCVPARNRYETCRFDDTRHGQPMNLTNLRLVMPFAADAWRLTTVLRNRYIDERQLPGKRFTLLQGYQFSKFAMSLPAYLVRRRDAPLRDGELEPLETAFYMLGTAPFMLVRQMMARGDATPLDPRPLDGERLYALSSSTRVLSSTRQRACPAAPKLIREFFDVIMNGSHDGSLDSPEVDRVLRTIGDWRRFYDYTLAASRLELLVRLAQVITTRTLLRVPRDDADAAALQPVLDAACDAGHLLPPPGADPLAVATVLLEIVAALLRDHGDDGTLQALAARGGLDASRGALSAAEATALIRGAIEVILPSAQRELRAAQQALGHTDWPGIGEAELLRRTAGAGLAPLLARWPVAPRRPALAAAA